MEIIYHFNRESSDRHLSVTAVCASLEPTFTQYFGHVPYNAQARNNIIKQLEEIVFKLVQAFSMRNRWRLKYYSWIHSNQIISPWKWWVHKGLIDQVSRRLTEDVSRVCEHMVSKILITPDSFVYYRSLESYCIDHRNLVCFIIIALHVYYKFH